MGGGHGREMRSMTGERKKKSTTIINASGEQQLLCAENVRYVED